MSDPAAPPITDNVARIVLETLTDGVRCQNSFDYNTGLGTPVTNSNLTALLTAWQTLVDTNLKGIFSPDTLLISVQASELHFGVTPTQQNLYAPGVVGTAGAHALSLELAAIVSKYANLKGKHGRGRWQFPAIPDTFITPASSPNTINATGLTAYQALATNLRASIYDGSNIWYPCISTRPIPPVTAVNNVALIASTVARDNISTQRRRRPGRGI